MVGGARLGVVVVAASSRSSFMASCSFALACSASPFCTTFRLDSWDPCFFMLSFGSADLRASFEPCFFMLSLGSVDLRASFEPCFFKFSFNPSPDFRFLTTSGVLGRGVLIFFSLPASSPSFSFISLVSLMEILEGMEGDVGDPPALDAASNSSRRAS